MKCVVQRVQRAEVRVEGSVRGACGSGALVLLCAMRGDGVVQAQRLAERVARFRFFGDERGRMNLSILDRLEAGESAGVLVVSQFTLAADGRKGRRPSFDQAAEPGLAEGLVARFCTHLKSLGVPVETGVFGAKMEVELINDGPVTFHLEERPE